MAKKRRKLPPGIMQVDFEPQTVRMRKYQTGAKMYWYWQAELAGAWLECRPQDSEGGCTQSGNAWLRRLEKQWGMKLAPQWEK